MLDVGKDIHSLMDFKRHASELVAQLYETERPIFLTVNGGPSVAVQEAEADQQFLNRLMALERRK